MIAKAKLKFSKAARSDLLELRRYSLERHGRAVADRYVDNVKSVFRLLEDQPQAGRSQPEFAEDIRCFSKNRHRVFYRIDGASLIILRVLHHAMDARRAVQEGTE